MNNPKCRFCSNPLAKSLVDLGAQPPCNNIVSPDRFNEPESVYPLHAYVCEDCHLVQVPNGVVRREDVFNPTYSYFSSFSASWLKHAERYVDAMIARFGFDNTSNVVEIASNDGYLLQYFKQRGVPCLGIEPTINTAREAQKKGIDTIVDFFGVSLGQEIRQKLAPADLIVANNVLAHVPDINDFVAGIGQLLSSEGVVTVEFPVLNKLIERNYFDTIYHEHFSYLSFTTVREIFACHGIVLFDVEELPTHGGSLRIYGRRVENVKLPVLPSVNDYLLVEEALGHYDPRYYARFAEKVARSKREILQWFIDARRREKTIVGFGAPGKGNTLLNYCGIRGDMLEFVVDDSPHKQGSFLPGSRIPIRSPDMIKVAEPDYVIIMPWNLKDEIAAKLSYIQEWGGKCVVLLPEVRVL